MLATNTAAVQNTTATKEETRPVRLLVPTRRRSDYWLSHEDTLRASDLGITRHTTDDELEQIVTEFGQTEFVTYRDDLFRLRDGLRVPRDVAEARAWGFDVPITAAENAEELSDDTRKRLGWWWVYDPNRTETRQQRRQRYLADQRLVDMKGFARVVCRAYITVKDRKFESDNIRKVLDDVEYRRDLAATIAQENPAVTAAQAEQKLLAKAREDVLKAMPPRRDRAGQSDQWSVADAARYGRDTERLDEWYEYNKIKQTGRPLGAKTRNRRTKANTK